MSVYAPDDDCAVSHVFAHAVVHLRDVLHEATQMQADNDPMAKNVLANFETAVHAFYDAFHRRHELAAAYADSDDYDETGDETSESGSECSWSAADSGPDEEPFPVHDAVAGQDTLDKCTICLTLYLERDKLRTLPCTHAFHAACIDHWMRISKRCPLCKAWYGSDNEEW